MGDRIVLIDDYSSVRQEVSQNLVATPRIFSSQIGLTEWELLSSTEWIRCIYGDSSGLYAGTQFSGQILRYDFEENSWTDLLLPQLSTQGYFNVYGIASYKGKIVASLAGFEDSTNRSMDKIKIYIGLYADSEWVDITPFYDSAKEYPLQFHKGIEFNDALYVISGERGVWKYDGSWSRLPRLPYQSWATWVPANDTGDIAMGIAVHKGKLYALAEKSATSVLEYDEAGNRWNPVDSVIETYDATIDTTDPDRGHRTYHNTPSRKHALVSDGEHLFVAGSGVPAVYMGDYGAPYGNEPKGWRSVRAGWCVNLRCLSSEDSYGMDIVGDTLYLANWKGLLKFPLADLDAAIAEEPSYPSSE